MSTVAPPLVSKLAADWRRIYSSAKISGVVGDQVHAKQGGYHIGRAYQSATNYSVVRPDDRNGGPDNAASAIDMSMNTTDMRLSTGRLVKAYANPTDPRRKYINAFNGTLDGKTARRWDVYARKTRSSTADHLWHNHLEIRRKYVSSVTAMKAILSILKGETVARYLASVGATTQGGLKGTSSTSTSAPVFPGTLKRDDSATAPNPAVKLFQSRLRARGWTSVVADGYFGPKLESVVKKWQASIHLPADGIIGPKTWPTPWTRPIGT